MNSSQPISHKSFQASALEKQGYSQRGTHTPDPRDRPRRLEHRNHTLRFSGSIIPLLFKQVQGSGQVLL